MTKTDSKRVIEVIESLSTTRIKNFDAQLFHSVPESHIENYRAWAKKVVSEAYETLSTSDRRANSDAVKAALPTYIPKFEVAAIVNLAVSRMNF